MHGRTVDTLQRTQHGLVLRNADIDMEKTVGISSEWEDSDSVLEIELLPPRLRNYLPGASSASPLASLKTALWAHCSLIYGLEHSY